MPRFRAFVLVLASILRAYARVFLRPWNTEAEQTRIRRHMKFFACTLQNKPLQFAWIDEGAGEKVGVPYFVRHLTLYDLQVWMVRWALTDMVLIYGWRINAVHLIRVDHISNRMGETLIQPYWIPERGAVFS